MFQFREYIHEFRFTNTDYVPTIRDLLNQASGVAPFFDFYNNHIAGDLYSQDETTIKYLKTKMSVVEPARKYCIYSDIGMCRNSRLCDRLSQIKDKISFGVKNIYSKLDFKNTCFNPLENGYHPGQIGATVDGHAKFWYN